MREGIQLPIPVTIDDGVGGAAGSGPETPTVDGAIHAARAGGVWLLFDDEVVLAVPPDRLEQAIVSENAYLLFYSRRNLTASNVVNLSV